MMINYLMVSSAGGQLPHGLVMAVNYLMASGDDGQLPHHGQLSHGF